MKIITKIETIKDWKRRYPPAGKDKQWKDCYSAKEFAKIVTDTYFNFEEHICEKLKFDKSFKICSDETYPERLSKFDENFRGPRHHDLACIAEVNDKKIALCFEAKVNESLDKQLSSYRETDGQKKRVNNILSSFFGCNYSEEKYGHIYYQILSSVAGSIAFAAENEINEVYFVLYQIKPTLKNQAKNIQQHIDALNDFISLFQNKNMISEKNNLVDLGELSIPRFIDDEPNKGKMHAKVKIAYIEQEVSGKKID